MAIYAPIRHYSWAWEDVPPSAWHQWLGNLPVPRSLSSFSMEIQGTQSPTDFHLVNLAFHLVNGALIAWLLARYGGWAAAIGASAWWLHPINSEAVVYIASRADLMLVMFTLIALLASRVSILAAAGWCVCAILAKETGVMSLPLVLLFRWWEGRRIPWAICGAALLPIALVAWRLLPRLYTWTDPSAESPVWFAAIQMAAVWRLLALLVWPVGFTVDHDWDAVTHLTAVVVCLATLFAVVVIWPSRTLRFAALWMGLALVPRFLVPMADWVNEHQMHLALVGVCLAGASSLHERTPCRAS